MAKSGSATNRPSSSPPNDTLEEYFERFHGELLGTLYHLLGNMEDAQDALQDTFVKCWRHRAQLPEIQNVRAWLFRIALNTGRDLRQTAWRRKRESLVHEEASVPSPQAGPATTAERSEQLERLTVAVGQLREPEREVFLLRQNGDLTYEEIAHALDIPIGTVKTRMRMALANLREVLVPPVRDPKQRV
ncbi:MAG: RNA polymerase sigma factor [Pirellulaceae bacterium]